MTMVYLTREEMLKYDAWCSLAPPGVRVGAEELRGSGVKLNDIQGFRQLGVAEREGNEFWLVEGVEVEQEISRTRSFKEALGDEVGPVGKKKAPNPIPQKQPAVVEEIHISPAAQKYFDYLDSVATRNNGAVRISYLTSVPKEVIDELLGCGVIVHSDWGGYYFRRVLAKRVVVDKSIKPNKVKNDQPSKEEKPVVSDALRETIKVLLAAAFASQNKMKKDFIRRLAPEIRKELESLGLVREFTTFFMLNMLKAKEIAESGQAKGA